VSGADSGRQGRREVAHRLLAVEYEDADFQYSDSEEERAPNYVVTPTGARVNRVFVVGVLTEVEPVSDDVLRARIVDPTGAFVAYAGQYQPEAVGFLEAAEAPSFVSLTGKARTFQPEGSEQVFTSVRPESITTVDAETRDRWTVQAAEHTLARIATMYWALEEDALGEDLTSSLREAGVAENLSAGVPLAIEQYGTTRGYLSALREQAIVATEVIAENRETVPDPELAPGDDGPVAGDLGTAPAVAGTITGDADLAPAPEPEPAVAETTEPETPPAGSEGDAEPEPDLDERSAADELGDFDASEAAVDASEPPAETYDLDEEEREEVEAEFGTEFSAGSEVAEPGEAGIEPETAPSSEDELDEAPSASSTEGMSSQEPEPVERSEAEPATADQATAEASDPAGDAEPAIDLEDAAVEAMAELDEGDGADREAVIESVVESHGADPAVVEDAIQDALMGGRCYEPADGSLKAI
jgi:RPA family protein